MRIRFVSINESYWLTCKYFWILRQFALSFMIGSIYDRSAFKARSSEPRNVISIYVHHDDLRNFAQITISVPDGCKGLTFNRTHDQRTNTYKSARGLPIDVPNHLLYAQHRIQINHGLPIDVPNHLLYFLHAYHHVQKARGSRSTLHTTSTTFQHAHHCVQKARSSIGICFIFSI
jgi:hypothetical protein